MKVFKLTALLVLGFVFVACGKAALSEETMLEVSKLNEVEQPWTPEQTNEAKNVLVKCYEEMTPMLVNIARKCDDPEEYISKTKDIEKETADVQKLYEKFMKSGYIQLQYDDVMNAKNKMLSQIERALAKN